VSEKSPPRLLEQAHVEPLDVDGVRTMAIGSVVWLVAFLALLPFYGRLQAGGDGWWLWTCLSGFGLGVIGFEYSRRRAAHLRRSRELGSGRGSGSGPGSTELPPNAPTT
jgi:hypothetical protein